MRISDWSSDVCSSDLLLDDPCWRLRKHHRAQREYRSDLDRDEAVALRPGSVGRATPIRCGHCLGGEASREWRIILKRSDERRVGQEWVSTFRSRWSP